MPMFGVAAAEAYAKAASTCVEACEVEVDHCQGSFASKVVLVWKHSQLPYQQAKGWA